MSAMYRLKAYFGMVPADEMDFVDDRDSYAGSRAGYDGRRGDRWASGGGRFGDGDDYGEYTNESGAAFDEGWAGRPSRESVRPARGGRDPMRSERDSVSLSGSGSGGFAGGSMPPVRGALAMDPESSPGALRDPVRAERPITVSPPAAVPATPPTAPTAVPEQRDRAAAGLSTITTLHPRSYNEARTIGERYREGVPVIMNLTELDDAAAKRLVDFAAGLVFALHGGFDKVTNRVFLLTPADVEVSADDARRIAERGGFRQD
ncbi:cell division protein SepF [Pseudonocardia endophytica]|uniref:Cell division protein SepF n=1 Tax=Pseudonocardia endophytica TaxID=401976 RepID=A0A4R1HS72_PSEEN|nr:cell division protein SepF [Pseudonocardia endophytica]TCK25028.1 cell division inhibitor SepF [Pseudonocardia endophytica]